MISLKGNTTLLIILVCVLTGVVLIIISLIIFIFIIRKRYKKFFKNGLKYRASVLNPRPLDHDKQELLKKCNQAHEPDSFLLQKNFLIFLNRTIKVLMLLVNQKMYTKIVIQTFDPMMILELN